MSFSFTVSGPRNEIRTKVEQELGQVIKTQPMHARDKDAVLRTVDSYKSLVVGDNLKVSVSGSVGWNEAPLPEDKDAPANEHVITGAGIHVSIWAI